MQLHIGRKLSLKERLSFKLLKWKAIKQLAEEESSKMGRKAQTIGILGISTLIAGLLIPYVILAALPLGILAIVFGSRAISENPKDHKGRTGKLLGIITLGGFALLLIAVVALLASWGG